jgi:hypothetical protein
METNESQQKGLRVIGSKGQQDSLLQVISAISPSLVNKNIVIVTQLGRAGMAEITVLLEADQSVKVVLTKLAIMFSENTDDKKIGTELAKSPRVIISDLSDLKIFLADVNQLAERESAGEETDSAKEIDPAVLAGVMEAKKSILRILQHDMKHARREKGQKYADIITKARETFKFEASVPDEEVEQFILSTKAEFSNVSERELEGLYCDVEGTLIQNDGTLNLTVLDKLKKARAEGKKVTLWTGGDLGEVKRKIADAVAGLNADGDEETVIMISGIEIVSKQDYAGATAEVIIDDLSPEDLYLQYGIRAKKLMVL